MDDSQKSFDPRILGETILKRKWHLVVPVALAFVASFGVLRMIPEIYRVESVLLFEVGAPLTGEVERQLLPGSGGSRSRQEDREAEANLLRIKVYSPEFLGTMAGEMGFLDNPAAIESAARKKAETGDPKTPEEIVRQDATAWLASMIEINLAGSNVYQITLEGPDRELLFRMSNLINAKLLNLVQTEQLGRLRAASSFTEEQIRIYKGKLDDARRELDRYLGSHPIGPSTPAAPRVDPTAAGRLADETGYEIVRITGRHDEAHRTLTSMYGVNVEAFVAGATPSLAPLAEGLRSYEKQLGLFLLDRSWNDPTVIAHNSRIGEMRSQIGETARRLAGSLLAEQPARVQEMAAELIRDRFVIDALAVRREALQQQSSWTAPAGPSAAAQSRRSQELAFLEDQVRINEEIYNSFVRQATSARISEAVETEQLTRSLQMITPPRWPAKPVRPNRPQVIGLGILIGLAFGAAAVLAGEYLDTSVKDVHEAEELVGAPILGTIPLIEYRFQPAVRPRLARRGVLVGVVSGILVACLAGYLVFRGSPEPAEETPAEDGVGAAGAPSAEEVRS